jgi:hypothetical protein
MMGATYQGKPPVLDGRPGLLCLQMVISNSDRRKGVESDRNPGIGPVGTNLCDWWFGVPTVRSSWSSGCRNWANFILGLGLDVTGRYLSEAI